MAINYIEKGEELHEAIIAAGYKMWEHDGVRYSDNDVAVQAIIDSFDPLPSMQANAIALIKEASVKTRNKYVTDAPGKDAEYSFKAKEAAQFDIDSSVGTFMQGRINRTGEAAAVIAAEWNLKNQQWQAVGAAIAGIEDKASADIKAETDWTKINAIALQYVAEIEAL